MNQFQYVVKHDTFKLQWKCISMCHWYTGTQKIFSYY